MSLSELPARVREAMEYKGLNIRQFSQETGIPYSSLQSYLRGERTPGAEALAAICTQLHISADWLLLGRGGMSGGSGSVTSAAGPASTTLAATKESEGKAAKKEIGIDDIATLAKLSVVDVAWSIMEALLQAYPGSLSLEQLTTSLESDPSQVAASISLLQHSGRLEVVDGAQIRLKLEAENEKLPTISLPDRYQATLTVASALLQKVLPAVERKEGWIGLIEGRVRTGAGRQLIEQLKEAAMKATNAAIEPDGEDEAFTVILGLAFKGAAK